MREEIMYYDSTPEIPWGLIIFLGLIAIITIVAWWKIFVKAGKPGWAAIIPIYNLVVMLEIVGKPVWWIVLFLIPLVNYVFIIWMYNMLSKSFGKSEGFTVGLVLLNPIFVWILGFGSAQYEGPYGLKGNAKSGALDQM